MRILISNDDGIQAKGLESLVKAFCARKHTVVVSAPARQQSGMAHALNVGRPLELIRGEALAEKYGIEAWAVDGTPTDSVKLYLEALAEEKPEYARYFTPWAQVTPTAFPNPAENQIIENYCSGVYLSPDQVIQLLKDMEQDPKVLEDLEGLWSNGQIAVLKKALSAAAKSGVGLLEATEVVEPNPISPNESTSYSNLYHCDRDGVYLYIDAVSGQLADAIGKNEG